MSAENIHIWEKLGLTKLPRLLAEISEIGEVGELSHVSEVGEVSDVTEVSKVSGVSKVGRVNKASKVSHIIEVSNVIVLVFCFSSKCFFEHLDCSYDNPARKFLPKFPIFLLKDRKYL